MYFLAPQYLPLHCTTCLQVVSAIWASPSKGIPGVLLQPIGLRLALSDWSFVALTNQRIFMLTNQDSAFRTNQIACVWYPHLHKDEPMRNRRQGLLVHVSQLPYSSESTLRTVPWARAEAPKMSCQSRAALLRRVMAHGQPHSSAVFTHHSWAIPWPCCSHSHAVSLFTLNKVLSFTTPQTASSWCQPQSDDNRKFKPFAILYNVYLPLSENSCRVASRLFRI